MNILLTWSDYPSIYSGSHLPAFNIVKHLSKKNDITLLCFRQVTKESKRFTGLEQYCKVIETVDLPIHQSLAYKMLLAIRNTFSLENLLAKKHCFFTPYYSAEMCKKFEYILTHGKFDLIYTDVVMAYLSRHIELPKVTHVFDCGTKAYFERYKNTRNPISKVPYWLIYRNIRINESMLCKDFDAIVVVADHEKDAINSFFPGTDIRVIPNGVDCEYFKPLGEEEEFPSLVFVGRMSHPPNVEGILYFHKYVYGHIKRKNPDVRLYVVGCEPVKEVQQLTSDETVTVTGYVEDVRPYLAKSSVVVIPMISGSGMKNKILEAMAMGKTVVTTSVGALGIDVTPGRNIIIADGAMVFAQRVTELLSNEQLRRVIGYEAQKFAETRYSWVNTADTVNKLFDEKQLEYANK